MFALPGPSRSLVVRGFVAQGVNSVDQGDGGTEGQRAGLTGLRGLTKPYRFDWVGFIRLKERTSKQARTTVALLVVALGS